MDLSFSGAGFMGCYYFGVVNCWNKYIPRDRVRRVAGASAGSLIAAYYLMDLPLDACLKEIVEMTEDVRARPLGVFDRSNQIVDVLPKLLDKLFPEDAHKRVNGRLFVSMTRLKDMKNVMVNQFDSKQDLIDALNCSCFIPVWSGNHVATYKGVKHIDGGFTNNLPVFDEHTIRISCFSGASDIAPCDKAQMLKFVGQGNAMGMPFHVNWKNLKRGGRALWPPPPSYIVGLLERGFHDTKDFILSNDLIQCKQCFNSTQHSAQPLRSKRLNPTISPGASPSVSRASSFLDLSDLHRSNSSKSTKSDEGGRRNRLSAGDNRSPPPAPRVHIKPHRQQQQPALVALFEQDRSKSGKKIKRKCLERSQSELYKTTTPQPPAVTCDDAGEQVDEVARVSFATKLREKLVRVASSTGLTTEPATDDDTRKKVQACEKHRQMAPMPTIVIEEEPASELQQQQQFDEIEAENDRQIVTIMDIMKAREQEEDEQEEEDESQQQPPSDEQDAQQVDARKNNKKKQLRTVSESSSGSISTHSSNDSAVGLDATPSPTIKGVSGSPAERFFASSHAARQVRAASLATSAPFTAEQQALLQRALQESQQHLNSLAPARFSAAPSPLPSCPPSPNLNRHCTECIRLRQQARMDGIDDSIRREAELYGTTRSKDPEREFNSFRARLTGWLKQLGTPKYSYSFGDDQEQPGAERGAENQTTPREQRRTAGLRRGSLVTVITPPSQIP